MFGWLKKWSGKERRAREEQEVKDATERAMVMARATAARREREKKAQAEADLARRRRLDADLEHDRELARRAEEDRQSQAHMLLQELTAQREAKRKPGPPTSTSRSPESVAVSQSDHQPFRLHIPGRDDVADEPVRTTLTGNGGSFDGGGASADWSAPDSQSDSSSSGDSSSGDSGGGGGGSD